MTTTQTDAPKARSEDSRQPEIHEIDESALDMATGGWGKSSYYSYGASSQTSYTARSSDKGGASS